MLLSSGVVWRHRIARRVPGGVPRRRPRAPAPNRRRARRGARVARVARCARRRARDGEPAHRRPPLRAARPDRGARAGSRRRAARTSRSRDAARSSRPAASASGSPASAACCCARARGARATGSRFALRARRRPLGRDGRVLRPQRCRRRGCRGGLRRAPRSSTARYALVLDDARPRVLLGEPSWSETDLVQAIARLPAGAAWYVVDARALRERVRERTVAEMVEAARAAGGDVRPADELPFPLPRVAEAARAAVPRGARARGRDAHDRRAAHRRARARPARRTARRSRVSTQRAPTRAGSSPAATAAGSRRRSSSAARGRDRPCDPTATRRLV